MLRVDAFSSKIQYYNVNLTTACLIMGTTAPVILVNRRDQITGYHSKYYAHTQGLLHRAFSVSLFRWRGNKTQILLQQRQHKKYHCAGLWSNACCSHPAPGPCTLQEAAQKRLLFELGIETVLYYSGSFYYRAVFDNGVIEHEIDHVFVGHVCVEKPIFNPDEVEKCCWVNWQSLVQSLEKKPALYTPWLASVLQISIQNPILHNTR